MLKYFLYFTCYSFSLALFSCRPGNVGNKRVDNASSTVIEWDRVSLKQLSATSNADSQTGYSYPRMIEARSGTLFCVFEHNGSIEMIKSTDRGNNWSQTSVITAARNGINIANPEIIELEKGALIIAYNLRPQPVAQGVYNPEKKFSICIKRSQDKGSSWNPEQLLYEAGSDFKNGCWEPSMVQLPGGAVQLFFANEEPYVNSNEQNISMLTSFNNGETWSADPEIVSFSKGFRDGMPVPVYDPSSNQVLLAIEDNSEGGEFNPSIIKLRQPFGQNAVGINSNDRLLLLQNEIHKGIYAGAPYLRKIRNDKLLLSFQSTLHRAADWQLSTMEVALGTLQGNFKLMERPFKIPDDKSALWNSLCILADNTVIALTSTNAFNHHRAIWMIRGSIKQIQ